MITLVYLHEAIVSLPSRGARVEILSPPPSMSAMTGRSPRGERGLKYGLVLLCFNGDESLPSRGARVEI